MYTYIHTYIYIYMYNIYNIYIHIDRFSFFFHLLVFLKKGKNIQITNLNTDFARINYSFICLTL